MVSQKNIKAWLPLSAVLLVSVAILGVMVHASTANTDKRSRESCSSAAHKQFHTDAKKATKEWWDQAEPRDEKGHQKLLKELKKQHATFHKAMRGKKSCLPVSLPMKNSVSSTVPTTGSPAKNAAPSPSPVVPSVSVPPPSGNGGPSLSVPAPTTAPTPSLIISPSASSVTVSSSSASGSSLSRVSSVSSSGTFISSSSIPSSAASTPFFSPITIRNITEDSATYDWTTAEPSRGNVEWAYMTPTGVFFEYGSLTNDTYPPSLQHSISNQDMVTDLFPPGMTFRVRAWSRQDVGDGTSIRKFSDWQTFQTFPIEHTQGNTTYTIVKGPNHYAVTTIDPDGIRYEISPTSSYPGWYWWHRPSSSCLSSFTHNIETTAFDRPTMVKDCAGNWSAFTVQKPPQ